MKTQNVMSELLKALGFKTMSESVLKTTDKETLAKYARVIIKNSPVDKRGQIAQSLHFLINEAA